MTFNLSVLQCLVSHGSLHKIKGKGKGSLSGKSINLKTPHATQWQRNRDITSHPKSRHHPHQCHSYHVFRMIPTTITPKFPKPTEKNNLATKESVPNSYTRNTYQSAHQSDNHHQIP